MPVTDSPGVDVGQAYQAFAKRLERIVRLDVGAPDVVVEDACQFAWSRLVDHARYVQPGGTLSWLATTAVREARRLNRRAGRELALDADLTEESPSRCPLPEEIAEQRAVLDLFRTLPDRQRRIVWLQALGLSYREISVAADCSPRTVERQLLRARRTVREAWGR